MSPIITKSGEMRPGCGMLFALPFALAGIGMACWTASIALRHTAMQSWVEVPAKILQTDFPGAGGGSHRAAAKYEYEFNGKTYQGERVALHEIADNFGDFQQRTHNELKQHQKTGKPLHSYVNPRDPTKSILYPQMRWELMSFFSIFPVVFGSAGLGMFAAAYVASRQTSNVTEEVPEDEPWRRRADWASGQVMTSAATSAAGPVLAVIAVWWWIASAPLTLKLPGMLRVSDNPVRWVTLLFPGIGALLTVAAVYLFLRRRKYGNTVLQLAATPGVVGGQLAGVLRIPHVIHIENGFRLKLSCIQRTVLNSGGKSRSHENVLWQDERLVAEPMREIASGATAVPVLFAIPFEASETSRNVSSQDIRWELDAHAATPGVNYNSRFEVPVFKTAESRADFQLDPKLVSDFAIAPSREMVLREAGILKESLPGSGVRLIFPAARNLVSAVAATGLLIFWSAGIWLMIRFGVPLLFALIFCVPAFIILWATVDLWLYRSVIEARSDGVTFRGGLLGIGIKRFWTVKEIQQFTTSETMSSGSHVWKGIDIVLQGGKQKTIAQAINSKLAQQAVIDELNTALGQN